MMDTVLRSLVQFFPAQTSQRALKVYFQLLRENVDKEIQIVGRVLFSAYWDQRILIG